MDLVFSLIASALVVYTLWPRARPQPQPQPQPQPKPGPSPESQPVTPIISGQIYRIRHAGKVVITEVGQSHVFYRCSMLKEVADCPKADFLANILPDEAPDKPPESPTEDEQFH